MSGVLTYVSGDGEIVAVVNGEEVNILKGLQLRIQNAETIVIISKGEGIDIRYESALPEDTDRLYFITVPEPEENSKSYGKYSYTNSVEYELMSFLLAVLIFLGLLVCCGIITQKFQQKFVFVDGKLKKREEE
jgi:hypothetical protein